MSIVVVSLVYSGFKQNGEIEVLQGMILSLFIGFALGLVPAHLARSRNRPNLAVVAVGTSMLSSFIGGLYLSIPTLIILSTLALLRQDANHR